MQHLSVRQLTLSFLLGMTLLGGCGKQQPAADAAKAAPEEKSSGSEKKGAASDGKGAAADDKGGAGEEKGAVGDKEEAGSGDVKLAADDVENLGIATTPAASVRYVPAKQGFGVILSHDAIAPAVPSRRAMRASAAWLRRTPACAVTTSATAWAIAS